MTPRPAPISYYPREAPSRSVDSLKVEAVKYLASALVAGLTAYYAAIYGIKEEVAVLKVRLEYMKEKVDSQTLAIERLTAAINAHTLAHQRGSQP